MTPHELSTLVKTLALGEGFDLVGITRPERTAYAEAYRAWIAAGKHGEMTYLAREVENRLEPGKRFPWARSVVCVGLAYWGEQEARSKKQEEGRIARYAWGRDYHRVVKGKLARVEKKLRAALGGMPLEARAFCDAGPLLERELAARAGLGWVGKNTLLIHPQHGSWFVLGELVLSLELETDAAVTDHCGSCRRCIEACPTEAITPYAVDATRCISYLTIEHRGPIAAGLDEPMRRAGYVIGCDICQEVCPFNRRPLPTRETDFAARPPAPAVRLTDIVRWSEQEWDILTRGRAFRRAKLPMWQRTAAILDGKDPGRGGYQ